MLSYVAFVALLVMYYIRPFLDLPDCVEIVVETVDTEFILSPEKLELLLVSPALLPPLLVALKHMKEMPVFFLASDSVFFTPSRCACIVSSPGRLLYAFETLL